MVAAWLRRNVGTYLDNATSRRDYRSQLRSNRSAMLWGIYLLVLIGIATLNYSMTADVGSISVVQAQSNLQNFYQIVMMMLAGLVCLIAPALGATTVIAERERRSLDLIFSAPVRPKMFLVGKAISAFRYTWMLLVLALPIAAVSVVLGGATWSDVLVAYLLLSLSALVMSSIALLLSTLAPKAVSAVIWSYVAVGLYLFLTSYGGLGYGFGMYFGSAGAQEAPFILGLSPFAATFVADTHTTMFGTEVPNWILVLLFSLLVVRFFLLAAGSALSPYNSRETKNLRISGLVYAFLLSLLITFTAYYAGPGMGSSDFDGYAAGVVTWVPLFLMIVAPFLFCYGNDAERKFMHDGAFSLKAAIRGTPAGGLLYLFLMLAALSIGIVVAVSLKGFAYLPGEQFLSGLYWSVGFWTLVWAMGRWASSQSRELRSARILHLALILMVFALPLPFFSLISAGSSHEIWYFYPMAALVMGEPYERFLLQFAMGTALLLFGLLLFGASERRRKAQEARPVGATA